MNSTTIIACLVTAIVSFAAGAWLVRDEKREKLAEAQRELVCLRDELARLRDIRDMAAQIANTVFERLFAERPGVRR